MSTLGSGIVTNDEGVYMKWIVRAWPYVLIAISLLGFAYLYWAGHF
jgi:hypothetical protein